MKAVALDYTNRTLIERDIPEPKLEREGQVRFRVREVGICGTDRDLASFRLLFPPAADNFLVLGHECVGEALESSSPDISVGDTVVPLVRRSCEPPCRWCSIGRRDLCSSGKYTERGIAGAHGYFTEQAVDFAEDLVVIPNAIREVAAFVEPLSVVEKAITNGFRLHPGRPGNALIIGAGAVGLLAAMALRARGLDVTVVSLEPEDSQRAELARAAGAAYTTCAGGQFDLVIEAAGASAAAQIALAALAPAGVLVTLGLDRPVEIPMLQLILRNQTVAGSVNAAPSDFGLAVEDLARFPAAVLTRMILRETWGAFRSTLTGPLRPAPKVLHVLD